MVPAVTVDLQDGFHDDEVVIEVSGRPERQLSHVTTKLLLGFAQSLEFEVDGPECLVRVALPRRSLAEHVVASAGAHVGASVAGNVLTLQVSDQPFGYA